MGKNKLPNGEKKPKYKLTAKQERNGKSMKAILRVVVPKLDSIHAQLKEKVAQGNWKDVSSIIDKGIQYSPPLPRTTTHKIHMFSFITFEPYARKSKWIPFLEYTDHFLSFEILCYYLPTKF